MKQHENDFDKGPLKVTDFNGGSGCQTVLSGNNRMSVKSTAKGHQWIRSQSGYSSTACDNAVAEDLLLQRLHTGHKAFAGNPGVMNQCMEIKFPGFIERILASDSQIRIEELPSHPIRAVHFQLREELVKTLPDNDLAHFNYIDTIKPSCQTVSHFPILIINSQFFGQSHGNIHYRWQKCMWLKQLVELITRHVYFVKTSMRMINKLIYN